MTHSEHPSGSSWLQVIKRSSEVEKLLAAFAAHSGFLPAGAHRTAATETLTENLRRVLSQRPVDAAVCFAQGMQLWLVTGTVCAGLSRECNAPVLWVNVYSKQGTLIEAGAWAFERDGTGRRCADHVDI